MRNPRRLLLFLGSMNVAVMLLVAIAVASVAGTILKQNQPDTDYLVKFGPFWYEVYQALGLFDVYSSAWFMAMLAFMMTSTGICITRHAPLVLRQVRDYRERLPEDAIRRRQNFQELVVPGDPEQVRARLREHLRGQGWRLRLRHNRISAMKGRLNRLSYLFVHASILIICAGGLLDSAAGLKLRIMKGELDIEQRDIPAAQVPARSRLDNDNPSFRSSVLISEGKGSNFSFINIGGGYLLQSLPFIIQLVDFRVEHYPSGQPKSFESDLLLRDAMDRPASAHTVRVNHPLKYRGYTIYQSSFADGGSTLELVMHPLSAPGDAPGASSETAAYLAPAVGALGTELALSATVGEPRPVVTAAGRQQLEITEFRKFNVLAEPDGDFVDRGPSMHYTLRNEDGSAREFQNYMLPVQIDGRYYMLGGVRSSVSEEFRFLYLPVDDDFSLARFFQFHEAVHDDALLAELAKKLAPAADAQDQGDISVEKAVVRFVQAFREGGFKSISDFVQNHVAEERRAAALKHYTRLLQTLLAAVYRHTFAQPPAAAQTTDEAAWREEADGEFFQDAVIALSSLPEYGAPVFVALHDFEHREASGLQITRAPGAKWVYLGFLLLVSGVFFMFYVSHQRLFILLKGEQGATRVLIAGDRTRRRKQEFAEEFATLCDAISRAAR